MNFNIVHDMWDPRLYGDIRHALVSSSGSGSAPQGVWPEVGKKMLIGPIHATRSFVTVSAFSQLAMGGGARPRTQKGNAARLEDDERAPDLH